MNQAISSERLYRMQPKEQAQMNQFQMKQNEFPTLPSQAMPKAAVGNRTVAPPGVEPKINESRDTAKILISVNENMLDMKGSMEEINYKVHQRS